MPNCSEYFSVVFLFHPNISGFTEDKTFVKDVAFYYFVFPLLIAVGFIGNCLVLFLLRRRVQFLSDGFRVHICALAVADMGLLLTYIPQVASDIMITEGRALDVLQKDFVVLKQVSYCLMSVFKYSSTWLIVVVSVTRTAAVWFPMKVKPWKEKRGAVIAVLVIFACVAAVNAPWWAVDRMCFIKAYDRWLAFPAQDPTIETFLYQHSFVWLSISVFFIVPFTAILVCNVLLIVNIWIARYTRRTLTQAENVSPNRQELRVTATLVIVTLVFLLTEGPDSVARLFVAARSGTFQKLEMTPWGQVTEMPSLLSNSINCIIYWLCSSNFQLAIKRTLSKDLLNNILTI